MISSARLRMGFMNWHPIKNAPHPAQKPHVVHIVRRFCLADAISIILNELLSYEHPSKGRAIGIFQGKSIY